MEKFGSMNALVMKIVVGVFWVLVAIACLQGWDGLLGWLPEFGLLVFGVHMLEAAFFYFKFKQKSDNLLLDLAQVLVFGIAHLQKFMPKH